jgi:hypothetical protein
VSTPEKEQDRFGWFGYPVLMIDRQEAESGGWFASNDDELRAGILDDLSYMNDHDASDEDKAEWLEVQTKTVDELVSEYVEDTDSLIIPVYMPEKETTNDNS